VTAGNSCPLNDGAAAVVVMSDARAAELGLKPRARIIASSVSGVAPEIMGVGPIEAVRKALKQAGMTIDEVDVVELNEAFAAQVLPVCREIGVDPFSDKLNPHGGAIALGHPYGMTGARIMNTLLNDLRTLDGKIGVETMCVGGGQGMAMVVERLHSEEPPLRASSQTITPAVCAILAASRLPIPPLPPSSGSCAPTTAPSWRSTCIRTRWRSDARTTQRRS